MSLREVIEGKQGVFYGRHSTDKQEMEMQRRSAKEVVTEFNGTLLPTEYPDEAVSATKVPLRKRTHLNKLLEDAQEHKFDFVITYSRDRLARDAYEHQVIREELHELRIPIVLASTKSVYDSGDVVIELMQDGLSQYEVEQTRARTRDTMVSRIEREQWVGRKPPYGYKFEEGKIVQVPDEIIIARDIFDRYLKGEGCHLIAKALGWKDKDNKYKGYKVKAIVTNPFYAGYLTAFKGKRNSHNSIADRDEWVESGDKLDMIPAILTKEEWERCWNFFDQRRKRLVSPRHYNTNFVLKGLAICQDCGREFQTVNQTTKSKTGKPYGGRYYLCKCRRFEADKFEKSIVEQTLDQVNHRLLVPGGVDAILDEVRVSLENDIVRFSREIKDLRWQINKSQQRIDEADTEMKRLFKEQDEKDDTTVKMLYVLQHYRLEKQAECNKLQQDTKNLEGKLEFIKSIELKHLNWDSLYADVVGGDRQSLRRFLVFLIDSIVVDDTGKVNEFRARVDLN